jgi:exosome complex component RRP42
MSNIVSRLKRKKIQEAVDQGRRMDGRSLSEYREFEIKPGILEKVEGSAEVKLGKTHIIIGVKTGEGTPYDDSPDEGVLIVNAEFTPVAHPTWEPGPPSDEAIELARVVDRGLRSAEILDMEDLAIITGEKVWLVFVDLFILNYDGNLIDASAAGALAALMNTSKPIYKIKKEKAELTEKTEKLNILKKPLAVTLAKIGDKFVVDPSADEEEVLDTRLTISLDEDNNIVSLQKSGSKGLTKEEFTQAMDIAVDKAEEIRKIVEESLNVE